MADKEYSKKYYQEHKENWVVNTEEKRLRKIKNQMAYAERNKEAVKKRRIDWTNSNFEWEIWSQAKRRARRSGIEFTLLREDIIIPEYCTYLGCKITTGWGNGNVATNASIDRVNNAKGYTKDNIQIISRMANTMKNNSTEEQLIAFAKGVLATHSKEVELL